MELLATHLGADFDAFSSVIVARRLHPEARCFFPGSREESVRRMISETEFELDELKQRQIEPAEIDRIVLCDTRQSQRIGVVDDWLRDRPEIEVVVYDHHPDSETDIRFGAGIVDPTVGATATLITEELERRGLDPTPNEATLLLLGIYEDTGALTFPTTSTRDFHAASRLFEAGADLGAVRRYALHSLDAQHLEVLHLMSRHLEVRRVNGHRVGLVGLELGRHVDELAPLVSRIVELFELPMLFALFGEGDRVTVIARGAVDEVDLGAILAEVADGGGHPTAAAGRLKGRTVLEAREILLAGLVRWLPPVGTAGDLAVRRFVAVDGGATVEEAKATLVETRVNAAPVMDDDRVVGLVSRQTLDSALQHELGGRPVSSVMGTDLAWVPPDEPADELARRISQGTPRFLLVSDDPTSGRPDGLVTRMSVLEHLYGRVAAAGESMDRRTRERPVRRRRVRQLVEERLTGGVKARLALAAEVAAEASATVYVVGGFVRDLLLGRPNRDVDLVVEGDGPAYARALAERAEGEVRVHEPFMTAVVKLGDGATIDVATARSEFYRSPAALPEVRQSALRQDLYRRDFTINTLAVQIGPDPVFDLVDFFGGQQDLRDGVIRVLHSLSFIDDPTRILRAVRLELRLGFEISDETRRLVTVALAEGVFERLSGPRLRDELRLLLGDSDTAVSGIERLHDLGALGALHPGLDLDERRAHELREAWAAWSWFRLQGLEAPRVDLARVMLLSLASSLWEGDRVELGDRLCLPSSDRERLATLVPRMRAASEVLSSPEPRPHEVRRACDTLDGDELLVLMAKLDSDGQAWIRRDLEELRFRVLTIGGDDLVAAGYAPGPHFGLALQATLEARLDDRIEASDEHGFAVKELERLKGRGSNGD